MKNFENLRNKYLTKAIAKYISIALCLFKGIVADSYKQNNDDCFWKLAYKNLFLCRHLEINSGFLLNKVSGASNVIETLSHKHILQRFKIHYMVKLFLCIAHDILSSKP